ncbi:MAG: Cys-tRNA(Pro) deacylase [Ruminococcaceae bacterium]|nr:Cys-tRNA(Pro) deacylase [Oscillospiraceae bacterium]
MAKDKEIKTNAMRFLETKKVKYTARSYECEEFIDGIDIATKLNIPMERTFKTLVAQGKSENYYVFVLPVAQELDLKAAARAVGEKSVELIHVKDINSVTGYIRGGCTPIGMKKQYKTIIHASARQFETIFISGGKIGLQLELNPEELAKIINAHFENIIF